MSPLEYLSLSLSSENPLVAPSSKKTYIQKLPKLSPLLPSKIPPPQKKHHLSWKKLSLQISLTAEPLSPLPCSCQPPPTPPCSWQSSKISHNWRITLQVSPPLPLKSTTWSFSSLSRGTTRPPKAAPPGKICYNNYPQSGGLHPSFVLHLPFFFLGVWLLSY